MAKRNKRKGLGHFLFGITTRTIMLMNAGVLLLSYLSMYVNPAKAWFMTVFGLLFFPFFIINICFLLSAASRGSRSYVIPLLALLPSLFLIGRYVQFNKVQDDGGEGITIVSYNVGAFDLYPEKSGLSSREECIEAVMAFLKECDADILSLQEFYVPKGEDVKEYVSRYFPDRNVEYYTSIDGDGAFGNVIITRFPVLGKDKFDFEDSANLALYADLSVDGRTFRVYNCHFQSYSVSVPGVLKGIAGKDDTIVAETEEKMRKSIGLRPQQVDAVLDDIKASSVEVIVTGDFNDTPMSYTYNQLKRGRKDSFIEAGRGLGGTYSLLWPFVRIDYVLYPDNVTAVSHKVEREKFSDHYPVITRLKL